MASLGLITFEGILAGLSFLAYFTLNEQKEKQVKKIVEKRREKVRAKLAGLIDESIRAREGKTTVIKITKEMEDKFQELFDKDYAEVSEPSRILGGMNHSFLYSGALLAVSAILDWAEGSSALAATTISALVPLEGELLALGILLLAVGIFNLERLRRITYEAPDLDPAPFSIILSFGLIFAIDTFLLWALGSTYSTLTVVGKAFFYSCFLAIPGILLTIGTWEEEDWRRNLGELLLLSPFIVLGISIAGYLLSARLMVG